MARTRDRALAVGVALAAHVLMFAFLLWRLGTAPDIAPPPIVNVQLMPALRQAAPLSGSRAVRGRLPSPRPERPVPAADNLPDTPGAQAVAPSPVVTPDGGVRRTLRALLGCEHAALLQLTLEERQRCQDRLGKSGAIAALNLDPRGAFAKPAEPYLARRPKNGCKVRAGGDVGPMGDEGPATGIACALSF